MLSNGIRRRRKRDGSARKLTQLDTESYPTLFLCMWGPNSSNFRIEIQINSPRSSRFSYSDKYQHTIEFGESITVGLFLPVIAHLNDKFQFS